MALYHGKQPVTKEDFKMAKDHLKATYKLNKQKIKDHADAIKKSSEPKSVAYNKSHAQEHQKDNSQIKKSMQTLLSRKGSNMAKFNTKKTGSYKGKSNAPGGGGRFKQMTDNGVSPGLASYLGRKKYGANRFAKMAAGKTN